MDKYSELMSLIKESNSILLVSHESPDRDAVGSLVSMKYILNQLGKDKDKDKVKMLLEMKSSVTDGFLTGQEEIIYDKLDNYIDEADLIIVLDVNNWSRVTKTAPEPGKAKVVIIDHHESPAVMRSDLYLKLSFSSNCEGIYSLFKDDIKLTPEIAKPLLMGIYSDTGGFKYRGVTEHTLEVVIELIKAGADISEIANEANKISADMLSVGNVILSNTVIDKQKKFFYGYLPRSISEEYNLGYEDIDLIKDVIISMLLNVEEIEWGFLVKPKPTGKCTLSIRSKIDSPITAKSIAAKFGGGGHDSAAGAPVDISDPKEAMEYVLNHLATN